VDSKNIMILLEENIYPFLSNISLKFKIVGANGTLKSFVLSIFPRAFS
jgi:hypothetical protein